VVTKNQREDLDKHLELEEKFHPLNRVVRDLDNYDKFILFGSWILVIACALCAAIVIVHQMNLRGHP
jgi:ABC-type Na+ transport system ATPase subunit NatA